jgi:hypothetical protein
VVENGISTLDFHYLVGTPDGVRYLQETHALGLFTQDEMAENLRAGGFELVEYDPEGMTGRGLYILKVS